MKKAMIILVAVFLSACQEQADVTKTSGTTDHIPVEVQRVVDGDTIDVVYNGKEESVRYLLIDTPELRDKEFGKQTFSEEATLRNEELLTSGEVSLEFDVGDRMDDYGRLLAYVYVDDVFIQEKLVGEGLARVAYVFPPNTRYLNALEKAEKHAKEQRLGIWKIDGYSTNRGFDSSIESNSTNDCLIKGNINRDGEKIYHIPSAEHYAETNPEEWFCTEVEAKKAGFRAAVQ
ncbi:thermonuclease family protein [Paenisporosarcina cavernae]|uniref:Thermonuclease family protein n=1 Tax=Paenisporosarcina cavernae TaxID=2320858 RepID=A0A385YTY7_9BACL|nr:thermonuclease family protein [Paenisporosarcina cavernae]AYC30136.1 thermonuclease family protein [Paenisporosarcina cavernae]